MRIALLLLAVAACNQPPTVEITSPAASTLITDHGTITVEVAAADEDLAMLALLLDGQPADAVFDPLTLPDDGACDGGCALTLAWQADEAREGEHTITVVATDSHDETGTADLAIAFEDVPTMTLSNPSAPDQLGVGTLDVLVDIQDRGDVTAELSIDGAPVDAQLTGDCRYGCALAFPWDTTGISGEHQVDAMVSDAGDRTATVTQAVTLGDIPFVDAIEVTGETDTLGFGDLEIEVHLQDADTNAWIGCSGDNQGLSGVDENDELYDVLGTFVDSSGARVSAAALTGRNLKVYVMEDDNFACPGGLDLLGDDEVGSISPVAADSLPDHAPMSFGGVVALQLDLGRPY